MRQAKFAADDADIGNQFIRSVAVSIDGTTALIGAENKMDMNSTGTGNGKVYVFEAADGSWSQQARFPLDDDEGTQFGGAVAASGDGTTALVGDVGPVGSAYVFTL